jgi:hypothetical protein
MLHNVGLYSLLNSRKKKKLTKTQRKRIANEKRRKLIANIIMHHQSLHQDNRKKAIERERQWVLSNIVSRPRSKSVLQLQREERNRKNQINSSLTRTKDRVYARRLRSRSRWNELLQSKITIP